MRQQGDEQHISARMSKGLRNNLQRNSEWHPYILDEASDLIQVITPDGHFCYVNKTLQRMLGYSQDEIAGLTIWNIIHPDDLSYCQEAFQKVISDEAAVNVETVLVTKDGETIAVEGNINCLFEEGKPVLILVIFRDITERKQAEEKLRDLYLHEKELREDLEAERKRRIEFTRVLVHELKTPLTPMLASSQLLAEEIHGEETLTRLANNISQGTLNLSSRIDEFLDLVKGEIGTLKLKLTPVDPLPLIQRMTEASAPMTSSNGHSLTLDLPSFMPLVMADENRLQQVVLNLLNNAFKFTPGGGKITVKARKKDTSMIVEVRDTGRGIMEEDQKRLFDPYYRVESDRQRYSGMGLGLALCKTLIELHGGRIWVKSSPGKGSTFSFSIPLAGFNRSVE